VATGCIPPDPAFKTKVEAICEVYELAIERAERAELTFSLDEMTGIPALERCMPDIPMKPGRCVKAEFEYIRHGTQTLIASFNVASGRIAQADVGESRTEKDLETHLRALLAQNPEAPKTHLVMDCLNTHQSEALVRIASSLSLSRSPLISEKRGKLAFSSR
jgi:hypothetical protein